MDLSSLNPPQRDAVLHGEGPLVVFAGAGSGKTRVITHRVAHLIAERGVPPWQILAVTFTNKAAGEMRERLSELVRSTKGLQVGTFHATCARFLRWHADLVGISKDFTIYDDSDQKAAVKRVINDLGIDPKAFPAKTLAGGINKAKQEVLAPDELELDGPWDEVLQKVYALYQERLEKASALDFGDLIYRLVRALESNDALRQELAGRFRYQLVDEFQDTNHAQLRLVKALASVHPNLCVVGDDDQSIYRWRGADRRNILDFKKTYPRTRIIKLEQNYRSTQRILRVAHAVIRRNSDREPKEMWTANDEGEPLLVVCAEDGRQEAREVVNGIREMKRQGHLLTDMAVFYRTHAQSRVLEEALRAADVPYRIVGGVRFYDRAEVKDLLAYLRVLVNPEDDVSLLRIINTPTRGIGKTTIGRLLDLAAETGVGVWRALEMIHDDDRFKTGVTKKLDAFRELVAGMQKGLKQGRYGLDDIGGVILHETGYVDMLKKEDTPEADARIQNLEELVGSMQRYGQEHPESELTDWLNEVTLQTDADRDDEEAKQTDRLTLMTVHAAKGLEFDTVIVTGLEDGLFPSRGTDPWEDPEELEEERRLAYVAFTRARQRLFLTFARRRWLRGREEVGSASRFLHEIPQEDARWVGMPQPQTRRKKAQEYVADPWDSPEPMGAAPGESYVDYSEGTDVAIRRGMRVRHPKFGVGEVRDVTQGAPPRVIVLFPGLGRKTIVARYLEPA